MSDRDLDHAHDVIVLSVAWSATAPNVRLGLSAQPPSPDLIISPDDSRPSSGHQREDWKRHKHECFGPTWWDDPNGVFPEEEKVGRR